MFIYHLYFTQIVCKELGFRDGKSLHRNALGGVAHGSVTAIGSLTNLNCTGAEATITDCESVYVPMCNFDDSVLEVASVICYDTMYSNVNSSKLIYILKFYSF